MRLTSANNTKSMSADSLPYDSVFTTETALGVWQMAPDSYDLPHPKVQESVIKIVCLVIARAFETMRGQGKDLNALSEDEITKDIKEYLENTVLKADGDPAQGGVPGFTRTIFRAVERQAQTQNYNQKKIRPSPDLWFLLNYDDRQRTIPSYDVVLVECKIVSDRSHQEVGGWYCDDGLIRFVNGDYAWAMHEGIMLAYVRDKRTIAGDMLPALFKPDRHDSLQVCSQPTSVPFKALLKHQGCLETIHRSTHGRAFDYLEGKGKAPPITVYHLWCHC